MSVKKKTPEPVITELKIRPDLKRLSDLITVDEYFALRDGEFEVKISVLSQFIIGDNGEYLDQEAGRKLFGSVKVAEVTRLFNQFMSDVEDFAVPLARSKTSE